MSSDTLQLRRSHSAKLFVFWDIPESMEGDQVILCVVFSQLFNVQWVPGKNIHVLQEEFG